MRHPEDQPSLDELQAEQTTYDDVCHEALPRLSDLNAELHQMRREMLKPELLPTVKKP